MKFDPLLTKAARLAKVKDYEGSLKILRAEEDRNYGSFKYYFLCAVVSLHAGIYIDALSNFKKAGQIKMKDPNTMLGLAVLYLKRLDTVRALDIYLDVKELDPKNKIAKNALDIIRKHSDSESLSEWLITEKYKKLFPPIPFSGITYKTLGALFAIIFSLFLLVSIILVNLSVIKNPLKPLGTRSTVEFTLTQQERNSPVTAQGAFRYILTRDQATGLYDRALSLFTSYRDEAAKINLNRILESNASDEIKNKSRLLFSYMETPGFDTFRRSDNINISQVRAEPFIYRNVHVIWSGMATNIELTDDFTKFDFLVGYDTRRTLEGIVSVTFDRTVSINPERPLEVLGRIVLLGDTSDIALEGVSIHQSGRLEN